MTTHLNVSRRGIAASVVILVIAAAALLLIGPSAQGSRSAPAPDLTRERAAVEAHIDAHAAERNALIASELPEEEKTGAAIRLASGCYRAAGISFIPGDGPTTYSTGFSVPKGQDGDVYREAMHEVSMRCYRFYELPIAKQFDDPGADGAYGLLDLVRMCANRHGVDLPKLVVRNDVTKIPNDAWSTIEPCVIEEGNKLSERSD